jgi:hypothetical protein
VAGEPDVMADQRGASVARRDASTGGSSDVWGRRPGSVVVVVGGTVVDVVVLVEPVEGVGVPADVDDPHPVATTARSIPPATVANRGNA